MFTSARKIKIHDNKKMSECYRDLRKSCCRQIHKNHHSRIFVRLLRLGRHNYEGHFYVKFIGKNVSTPNFIDKSILNNWHFNKIWTQKMLTLFPVRQTFRTTISTEIDIEMYQTLQSPIPGRS